MLGVKDFQQCDMICFITLKKTAKSKKITYGDNFFNKNFKLNKTKIRYFNPLKKVIQIVTLSFKSLKTIICTTAMLKFMTRAFFSVMIAIMCARGDC